MEPRRRWLLLRTNATLVARAPGVAVAPEAAGHTIIEFGE
jgi:hypothetical protein